MNIHKNARLAFARRLEMVLDMTKGKFTYTTTPAAHGVNVPTMRKWVGWYRDAGVELRYVVKEALIDALWR